MDDENIEIWLVGNTGLRNPNRIQEGFEVFSKSSYVGHLHGRDNEIGFMNLLNEKGIIQNESGKDASGSHARKWRLMFSKNGFIYPKLTRKEGDQDKLGAEDTITPFGETFLKADTLPAVQECFLRSMSVEQYIIHGTDELFSPLRWMLAIMLELEKRTGSTEISRIEFSLWGHATDPRYNISDVVDHILDLRERREKAPAKRKFDRQEIEVRAEHYNKMPSNFTDYSDMNMRYLRVTGLFQRKGRGLMITPSKHVLAEALAKTTGSKMPIMMAYKELSVGATLPTDDIKVAKEVLNDMMKQMKERHIVFDISDLPLNTASEINIARMRLENIMAQTDEIQYAQEQKDEWHEISDYMTLLMKGGGRIEYGDDHIIEVPKDETPAYLEWTIWRAILAIDHLVNQPYEVRGFRLDSDFLPVSAAGGGRGDLYCEFKDFTILTEVTMSSGSRQESMEGEPVRRHVSDAIDMYDKPVYGLFIANVIDTNTAETFRNAIWYTKDDVKQRLDIIPITLRQFQLYFDALFEDNDVTPKRLLDLIMNCKFAGHNYEAPKWKKYINDTICNYAASLQLTHEDIDDKKCIQGWDTDICKNNAGEPNAYSVKWRCPDCGGFNDSFEFLNNRQKKASSFTAYHTCADCGKTFKVQCNVDNQVKK